MCVDVCVCVCVCECSDIVLVVIGNKTDLEDRRLISTDEGKVRLYILPACCVRQKKKKTLKVFGF